MTLLGLILPRVTGIRGRQRLLIVLACSLVLVAALAASLACGLLVSGREDRDRLASLGGVLAAQMGTAAAGDDAAVARTLDSLRADPGISRAAVLDAAGRARAQYWARGGL